MGLGLGGGCLVCFVRFCDTFGDVLARGKRRGGLSAVGHADAEACRDSVAASTIFRTFSRMVFALRRTNSIVRFWELIACRVGRVYFARLVVCFVGFRAGAGNWGA